MGEPWRRVLGARSSYLVRDARATLVCALFAAALLLATPAFAADFSAFSPAGGGFLGTNRPVVSVLVTDTVPITTGNININGFLQGYQYLEYPIGHWEDDGCDSWWVVDDYRTVRVVADFTQYWLSPLPYGPTTAQVTVKNSNNVTSSSTWSFTLDQNPAITSVSPADGAYIMDRSPAITVAATDDDVLSGLMTVDGSLVLPTQSPAGTFTYTPPMPFDDHSNHLVAFTVIDDNGLMASRTWGFRIDTHAPVTFSALKPPAGTITTQPVPVIEIVADNELFSMSNTDAYTQLLLDGQPIPTTVTYPFAHWYDDGCDAYWIIDDNTVLKLASNVGLYRDGAHTATARVRDSRGLTAEETWSFTIEAPPVASELKPAKATPYLQPTFSAKVVDNDPGPITVVVKIDDVVRASSFNASTGYVTCTPPAPLSDNTTHTVTLEMTDSNGHASAKSWPVKVQTNAAATFADRSPAKDSNPTSSYLAVGVSATSAFDLPRATWKMFIDSVRITDAWTYQYNPTKSAVVRNATTYTDGPHVVRAEVDDVNGVTSIDQWTFTVKAPPTLQAPMPANGQTVGVARPSISVDIADNTPGNVNVSMTVDGFVVKTGSFPLGRVSWSPTTDWANHSSHSISVTATDAGGNSKTLAWSFNIVATMPMDFSQPCTDCHWDQPQAHPMDNCTACHGYGDYHGVGYAPTPAGACLGCHDYYHGWTYIAGMQCTACHAVTSPTVPRHDPIPTEAKHASTFSAGCGSCHSSLLVTEHGKYPTTSEFKYQCTVCHASADTKVKAAISSANVACTGCHENAGDHTAMHASTPIHDSCPSCHAGDLVTEHVRRRGMSCRDCHGAGFPVSGAAAATSGKALKGAAVAPASQADPDFGILSAAYVNPTEIEQALANGDTSCDACHESMPHGSRTDCTTCHGTVPPSIDSTEPTVTPTGSTYVTWSTALGGNTADDTPHKGYTVTTVKCGVCHSVHTASIGGELLLRGTVRAACEYCHIYTNVGIVVVYGGDPDAYYGIHDDEAHNRTSESMCVSCHSVHGANTMAGANAEKILWDWDKSPRSDYSTPVLAAWPTPGTLADDDAQITAFCTGCHAYYTQSYKQVQQAQGFDHQTTYNWTWGPKVSHVMTDTAGGFSDRASELAPGSTVAWRGSRYCRSCHDAGGTDQGPGVHADSFPHSVPGYTRFMTSATAADASATPSSRSNADGPCLKCHRSGTLGVGANF